jgi:hypothetical protein
MIVYRTTPALFQYSHQTVDRLEKYGIQMPAFSKIGGILANELSVDEAACKHLSDIRGAGLTACLVEFNTSL